MSKTNLYYGQSGVSGLLVSHDGVLEHLEHRVAEEVDKLLLDEGRVEQNIQVELDKVVQHRHAPRVNKKFFYRK